MFWNIFLKIMVISILLQAEAKNNKTDFNFLIQEGYRPKVHTFAKYIVSLQSSFTPEGGFHFCSGSIYNEREIITAAHCVVNKSHVNTDITVVAGTLNRYVLSPNAQIRKVKEIIVHPKYDIKKRVADLAIIILKEDLQLDNKTVQAIQLINKTVSTKIKCTTLGWGRLYSGGPSPAELVYLDLPIWSFEKCKKEQSKTFARGMICGRYPNETASGVGRGDSGGPVICEKKLVGVISWTDIFGRKPSVFTDVYYYYKWLLTKSSASQNLQMTCLTLFALEIVLILN